MRTTFFDNKPHIEGEEDCKAYILLSAEDFQEAYSDTASTILYLDRKGVGVCEIYCDFIDADNSYDILEFKCYNNGEPVAAFCADNVTVYFIFNEVLYVLRG